MRPHLSSLYESSHICRSGLEVSKDFHRKGGYGERICLADTYLSEREFLQDVSDFRNDLTMEWPGKNLLSPGRVFQCCLKYGSGHYNQTFWTLHSF